MAQSPVTILPRFPQRALHFNFPKYNEHQPGQCGNEGDGGVGAVHIPGTPTGIDANSIMLACFGSGEDGEFGSYDVTALEYLY